MTVLNQEEDEYDALGKTYATKLRRMPTAQRDIADKLINDVLFKGLMSHLTSSSFLSEYRYSSGAWLATDKFSSTSASSNPTPSTTPGPFCYPKHSPELNLRTIFPLF